MSDYSSVDAVKAYTNVKYMDLGLKDDDALDALIEDYLTKAKSYIDGNRRRDYKAEVDASERTEIPPGIHDIAKRIASNMLLHAITRRATPTAQPADIPKVSEDPIFTDAIKEDLKAFPIYPRVRIHRIDTSTDEDEE